MRTTHPHRIAALLATAVSALLLTACGTDSNGGTPDGTPAPPPGPARMSPVPSNANYNPADVVFAQDTLALLKQADEMSALAAERASGPKVKALAAKARKDREPALILLPRWLEENGQPAPPSAPPTGGNGTVGLANAEDLAALDSARGEAFDRLYLQLMVEISEASANLYEAQQWSGMSGPLMNLAHKLSDDQKTEIVELRRLLGR